MPSIGMNVKEFLAELDNAGIDEVRIRLATGIYNEKVGEKGAIAREWLTRKDLERTSSSQAEQAATASRAAVAAERAAEAAERAAEAAERQASNADRANRIATGALIIAICTAILTLVLAAMGK